MLEAMQTFDNSLLDLIQTNLRSGVLDAVMPVISALGNAGAVWIAAAIVFICQKKYRTVGLTVLVALILCGLIGNLGLKPLIARPRPCDVNPDIMLLILRPTDYSFPSGHTLSSFASAAVIFWYDKRWGYCALAFGAVMAFSRLYLYVHYPTDVFGGMVIGVGLGIAAVFLVRLAMARVEKRQ